MTFYSFLKIAREHCGITQAEFAEKVGVSTTTIQNWEKDTLPDKSYWQVIIDQLKLSREEFIRHYTNTVLPCDNKTSVQPFPDFLFPDNLVNAIKKMKLTADEQELLGLETFYFIDKNVDFNDPAVQLKDSEKAILGTLPDGTLTVREGTKKGYAEVKEWQIINLAIPGSKNRRGRVGDNAKTITTAPRQAIYYHGKVRMLTAKEYLRLMGYRDCDYEKMSQAGITDQQICQLAGNSICVPVLEALFRQLYVMDIIQNPSEVLKQTLSKPKQRCEKSASVKTVQDTDQATTNS